MDKKKPPLESKLVEEFVSKSHADLERVQELLAREPGLINTTWDWGGGDFESAIGAAGHMGRKDIANYLLEHGARMDIFVAAMLGKLEIVRAALAAFPNAKDVRGPHGIPLSAHAEAGGDEARAVADFLSSLPR